ncbi:hypothetical protein [Pararobbsia silviterrae]|uniref:hypothetical protein n=1 Tax=Pararobbsia silviterrae TaxID=1792498 RepID=UPI0011C39690|nr:hypothetical protein [Pararobbsia silviterrae]
MNVQFELPVGALVNGWRHLGDGRFAADTSLPVGLGYPPHWIECVVADPQAPPAPVPAAPFSDPMPDVAYRVLVDVSHPPASAGKP